MQRKRIHVISETKSTGGTTVLAATVDETNGVNFHNVHFGVSVEPEVADANANGTWVLWCIPDAVSAVPGISVSLLEAEGSNPYLWAMGVWVAANQTGFNSLDNVIRSSRNCPAGGRLVLSIRVEGVTSGNCRILGYITYNTKSL